MKSKVKQNYSEQLRMLVKRHLLVFFNNRMRVFFTLMVPFIVFVIYIFFLRNLELLTVKDVFRESTIDVLKNFDPAGNAEINRHVGTILDSWMLSGIMAFSTLTVSLQTNNIIVADKENGINRDFASSPVSNTILILSYFIFNFIVTLIVSFIFIVVCFIYLAALGEFVLTFLDVITILGVLLFSTINSVLFTILICSFVSKDMTMVSIMTVFSSAIGFLIHDARRRAERVLFHSRNILLFAVQVFIPVDAHCAGKRIHCGRRPRCGSADTRRTDGQFRV